MAARKGHGVRVSFSNGKFLVDVLGDHGNKGRPIARTVLEETDDKATRQAKLADLDTQVSAAKGRS